MRYVVCLWLLFIECTLCVPPEMVEASARKAALLCEFEGLTKKEKYGAKGLDLLYNAWRLGGEKEGSLKIDPRLLIYLGFTWDSDKYLEDMKEVDSNFLIKLKGLGVTLGRTPEEYADMLLVAWHNCDSSLDVMGLLQESLVQIREAEDKKFPFLEGSDLASGDFLSGDGIVLGSAPLKISAPLMAALMEEVLISRPEYYKDDKELTLLSLLPVIDGFSEDDYYVRPSVYERLTSREKFSDKGILANADFVRHICDNFEEDKYRRMDPKDRETFVKANIKKDKGTEFLVEKIYKLELSK